MAYIKEGVCRCKPSYAGNGAVCGNDKVSIRKTYISKKHWALSIMPFLGYIRVPGRGGAKNNFCQLHLTRSREGTEFMQNDK